MTYADGTKVTVARSRDEIERTLARYDAEAFAYGYDAHVGSVIAFRSHGRQVQFTIPQPNRADVARTPTGLRRTGRALQDAYDREDRRRWRALALCIKAKLEAVESGITSFEDEFLAHTVLPDGTTLGAWIGPQIDAAYETGRMPAMLPALTTGGSTDGQ